jgi:metal-responsive CopG/Arc/MetJ family transcriptional regulator
LQDETRSESLKPVSVKLEPDLVSELDRISEREFRSRSGTVKLALIAYVEADKSRPSIKNRGRRVHANAK